jgi:phytanoyl-CoA hydroxylase
MLDAVTLSDAQLAQWRDEGWVGLGRILDDDLLAAHRAAEARFRRLPQYSLPDGKTILPDSSTIFRNQLSNYCEPLRRLYLNGPHLPAIRQLVGPIVSGLFTQFVTKLPDPNVASAEFPWHQDNGYGAKTAPNNVTVWCALDDVDEQNGCVWIIPGSHKGGLLPHRTSGTSWHLTVAAPSDGIPARLKAGEAVAFNGLTLHRSLANHTNQPRRAFFMSYGDFLANQDKPPFMVAHPIDLIYGELPYPGEQR